MIRITDTFHEDRCTFVIICRSFPLRMRNVLDKFVDKIKTRILCSLTFFFENRADYEIMWENIVESQRKQTTILRIACFIPNATNTHTEYVIIIVFSRQQW